MTYDVFLSYSRAASRPHAIALREALCGTLPADRVFLDTSDIVPGAQFPDELAAAVAASRAVVVFADALYFARPWCVREFEAALGGDGEERGVLIALPPEGDLDSLLLHLPPALARRAWPQANETAAIAAMVARALGAGLDRSLDVPAESALRPEGMTPPLPWRAQQRVAVDTAPESLGDGFIGREHTLWRIFRGLETRRAGGRGRSLLLHGGAGSGKSQLAAEFLRRAGPRHYDVVCWLDADVPDEQWRGQIDALGPLLAPAATAAAAGSSPKGPGLKESCAARAASGQRILWVVDNLPEPQAGQQPAPLDHWCPPLGHVSLLLTSRRPQVHGCDETLVVDALPADAAVRVLTRPDVDPRWLSGADWSAICRWVGGLPLALGILQAGLADGSLAAEALRAAVDTTEPAPALDEEVAQLAEVMPAGTLRGIGDALGASLAALERQTSAHQALAALARLEPWALGESLVDLFATAAERALLARRGWLQPATGSDGHRTWRLHRVTASFVRHRTAMDGERVLLDRLADSIEKNRLALGVTRELGRHLIKGLAPMVARINRAPEFPQAVVEAGRRFGAAAALTHLGDTDWRGLRYVGAGWASAFGAGAIVEARANAVLARGDEKEVADLPAALQPLGRMPEVARIIAGLLEDPRDAPRWHAIVHAGAYSAPVVLEPLWQALASEPVDAVRKNGMPVLANLMRAPDAPLRALLTHAASRTDDSSAAVRGIVVAVLGEALELLGESGAAGGFSAAWLRAALLQMLRRESDPDVRQKAAEALGVRHAETSWQALVDALRSEKTAAARNDLATYLRAVERPQAPRGASFDIDEEGKESIRVDLGGKGVPRPDLWQPLVEQAVRADGSGDDDALALLGQPSGGHGALSTSFEALLDRSGPPHEAVRLADRCVAQFPDDPNFRWWRGMAREVTGEAAGALADFEAVADAAPQFGYAFKRIARLRLARGDLEAARQAFARAQALIPEDPEMAALASALAGAGAAGT
ncbi:MAG: TIR domain-containing protein [Reyranella sp.]|uniref:TIR domain-containing protein n=1 Tax=Reyranella sp. TaxID=1929291 RepID=UPI003D0F458F